MSKMLTAICEQTLTLDSSLTQSPSFLSRGGSSVIQDSTQITNIYVNHISSAQAAYMNASLLRQQFEHTYVHTRGRLIVIVPLHIWLPGSFCNL